VPLARVKGIKGRSFSATKEEKGDMSMSRDPDRNLFLFRLSSPPSYKFSIRKRYGSNML
jgi:hypothetical protein